MAIHRFSYVFEIDTPNPVLVWTGFGALTVGSKSYIGAGDLISLPDIQQLINGIAERLDVTLSGVSDEALRLLEEEKADFPLTDARLGRVNFDEKWQVDGDIEYLWTGISDILRVQSVPSSDGRERQLVAGFASGNTRRSNPNFEYWTDADQRRRSPDDAFYTYAAQITQGLSRTFGPL